MTRQNRVAPPGRWRAVDGIVLLDKPQGLTSTQALQRVRRHLQAEKAGHAGTLDPMATGMLPLCFGQATKACGTLLGRRKAYRATVRLGVATDTGDAEGQPVAEVDVPVFDADRLEQALAALRGERLQVPPMYSALKRDGRPLYELARQGIEVEREARPITIKSLVVTGQGDRTIDIEVVCSKGTYVRVLADEIAAGLGTRAHLLALRRRWVEPFEAAAMATLAEIEATPMAEAAHAPWLAAVDTAFPDLPVLALNAGQTLRLCQGRTLARPAGLPSAAHYRAYDPAGRFLGLVEPGAAGLLQVQRLFVPGAGTNGIGPKT
ncbi:MAG: tRNA pseudouridine(55) synthase TruB [Proteobacteria bacterium]|nr:tRNA pseudouridine(55) synthase TruB [Pseudomonadota bacterium]